jgi:Flp pilus assembly protein TadG
VTPWRARPWPADDDRGSAAAQLAVLLPVFVLFYGLVTYSGRSATAQASTEGAARWAARTISIARDPSSAVGDAEADAAATLEVGSRACQAMAFSAAVSDSEVTVTISCEVDVSELMLLPIPGTRAIEATATEVRDRYREGPGA